MEAGFILDTTYRASFPACWHRGVPARPKGLLARLGSGYGISARVDQMHEVTAYRCEQCGRLTLYAKRPVKGRKEGPGP